MCGVTGESVTTDACGVTGETARPVPCGGDGSRTSLHHCPLPDCGRGRQQRACSDLSTHGYGKGAVACVFT